MFILPLHKAIEKEDQSVINRWLQNGKKKVNKCRGGRANHRHFVVADGTALHWAVYYGKLDIAQQLLRQDAGISIKVVRPIFFMITMYTVQHKQFRFITAKCDIKQDFLS